MLRVQLCIAKGEPGSQHSHRTGPPEVGAATVCRRKKREPKNCDRTIPAAASRPGNQNDCGHWLSCCAARIRYVQPWRLAWARTVPSGMFILRAISRRPKPPKKAVLICSQVSWVIFRRIRVWTIILPLVRLYNSNLSAANGIGAALGMALRARCRRRLRPRRRR